MKLILPILLLTSFPFGIDNPDVKEYDRWLKFYQINEGDFKSKADSTSEKLDIIDYFERNNCSPEIIDGFVFANWYSAEFVRYHLTPLHRKEGIAEVHAIITDKNPKMVKIEIASYGTEKKHHIKKIEREVFGFIGKSEWVNPRYGTNLKPNEKETAKNY